MKTERNPENKWETKIINELEKNYSMKINTAEKMDFTLKVMVDFFFIEEFHPTEGSSGLELEKYIERNEWVEFIYEKFDEVNKEINKLCPVNKNK